MKHCSGNDRLPSASKLQYFRNGKNELRVSSATAELTLFFAARQKTVKSSNYTKRAQCGIMRTNPQTSQIRSGGDVQKRMGKAEVPGHALSTQLHH